MKINAHVLEASDRGDKLSVTAQGKAVGAAEWQPFMSILVNVPMTDRNKRAFYIGREIDVIVTPR
ncbi:hypothetical protein M2222_001366 [Bradyrhizobium elkanii]|uniref:hypothetical protein n=1 Tax=Bradyrhizobium elkanii TaxID=29448 RepID=UPI0021676939|nr:hypothetical protein [Bradyrhizobium elkanii]MCS3449813.1 hypothetical protein [Bradyrhizobium elkanii]MCS3559044.1 hypothetical protein [Bradyrhizobium elkanii]MCW2151110.1 hypothetical protein [Bradyrhizobium elkanii]MCW2374841.1 hypothetical protein [Bradyrhizobium elkanii]